MCQNANMHGGVWLIVSMLQGWLWRLWRDARPPAA